MKKILGIWFIVGCLLFDLICYNALLVTHYDVDPVSVLASLLNISIQTLGYASGALSVVFFILGIFVGRSD